MNRILVKQIISWLLVIIWLIVIFMLSNMPSIESNYKSERTIYKTIEKTLYRTNNIGITDKHPSTDKLNNISEYLNKPLRKFMHASVYLILSILVLNAFKVSNIKYIYLYTLIFCFIYACSDEYHQTFILGRTGKFIDVIIDTIGTSIGLYLYKITTKLIYRFKGD